MLRQVRIFSRFARSATSAESPRNASGKCRSPRALLSELHDPLKWSSALGVEATCLGGNQASKGRLHGGCSHAKRKTNHFKNWTRASLKAPATIVTLLVTLLGN